MFKMNRSILKIVPTLITIVCIWPVLCLTITVERKNIVDNGGYIIRNAGIIFNDTENDLVLQAEPPVSDEVLGKVTLSVNEGLRNQKWGVAYYGGATASLSPGLNPKNTITAYFPQSGLFTRLQDRQYTFANCYGNELFKITNVETKMCLCIENGDNGEYIVDLASCDDPDAKIYWTFERYG